MLTACQIGYVVKYTLFFKFLHTNLLEFINDDIIICLLFSWHKRQLGLAPDVLTNNVAEISNAIFKSYLKVVGVPYDDLNKKNLSEVIIASVTYLESEWQSLDRAVYGQGEFEIKPSFRHLMKKKVEEMPGYHIPTSNDIIARVNKLRSGVLCHN